jgi:hypothetical protein
MPNPRVFISYSWSTPEQEKWVIDMATELRDSGVDAILDKWDLREGHDAHAFMERMVSDESIKKVIIVCDKEYAGKADKRKGGVGAETQIITAEIYNKVDQNKFVAVVAEKDDTGKPFLPIFYTSRIYIDLSEEDTYARNFEQLLRWVYDKPIYLKPEIGKPPAFLEEQENIALGTSVLFKRTIDAIKNAKPYAMGSLAEYLDIFSTNLEKFRLEPSGGNNEFDQKVITSIEQFTPYRNEAVEIFNVISNYDIQEQTGDRLHDFFESLIPYLKRPERTTSFHEWDWDNFKFIVHELFLNCIASLIKNNRFELVRKLTQERYFVARDDDDGCNIMKNYTVFCVGLRSLEHRNKRLSLRRLSLHADLLKERSRVPETAFERLMQADFALYLLALLKNQRWWPVTLVYKSRYGVQPFEMFQRAESKKYFDKMKIVFDISKKEDLFPLIEGFNQNRIRVPSWEFESISPVRLMNYDNLYTI